MQNGSAWNFPLAPNISVQRVHQPIFQNQRPFILLPLFFKECLNPQVRINKMVNVSITTLVIHDFPKDTSSVISIDCSGFIMSFQNI